MAEETRQLGRYELIKRIAVGGMGVIYLAKSRGAAGFEKTVIIKKILEHLAEEQEFITKFLDEGRIVVNLAHGNIVPVFDMGEEDGEYFIAMEYVPGRDLRDVLKRLQREDTILPAHLAVYIVTEACKGLDYAHRRTDDAGESLNIVHRDVSPSNILISRDGEVKVIDFGIARATSRAAKTVSGRIQGKICYMSPEQAAGKSVDARSDIFSMGVVLYEMLTGRRPFQGESDLQSLDLVRKCEFVTPSELNPEIPAELDAIVDKALSRDLERRYQSIDELHVELLQWLYSGGSAVTSQQLAEFVRELFPEGIEREELRRARDASSTNRSNDRPMNLDEALNAELDKLAADGGAATDDIDPLRTTATEMANEAQNLARGKTATLDSGPVGRSTPAASPQTDGSTQNPAQEGESRQTLIESSDDVPQPTTGTSTAEAARDDDRPTGFKRWIAIAMAVAFVTGGAVFYTYASTEYGKVVVHTKPDGAAIKVDGVKVSGAKTPYTVELETGEHNIELIKDGYAEQTLSVEVKRHKKVLLDNGTIELQHAKAPAKQPRQAWVAVTPEDAVIDINDGERKETGKAKITVAPGEQVLLEVSHPGCQPLSEVVTYEEAAKGVELSMTCKPADADKIADAGADAAKAAPPTANKTEHHAQPAAPRYKRVRFASKPAGAHIELDGKPVRGATRLRIGQSVHLIAQLDGYRPVDKKVRVSHNWDNRYTIALDKLPTGCLLVRPAVGLQVKVSIDGKAHGETAGARIKVPSGPHKVVLTWGDGFSKSYDVTVPQDKCTSPIGFEHTATN